MINIDMPMISQTNHIDLNVKGMQDNINKLFCCKNQVYNAYLQKKFWFFDYYNQFILMSSRFYLLFDIIISFYLIYMVYDSIAGVEFRG